MALTGGSVSTFSLLTNGTSNFNHCTIGLNFGVEIELESVLKAWRKFILGDNSCLKVVYEKHHAALLFQAYHYLKDENRAHDVVADIFVKLLEMTPTERNDRLSEVSEKLDVFLKVLVKNKCLDSIRVLDNRKNILGNIHSLFARSSRNHEMTANDFAVMMEFLPAQQRNILQMHLDGFDNNAISEKLNISYNTCRNTLSTAKRKTRELWVTFMN